MITGNKQTITTVLPFSGFTEAIGNSRSSQYVINTPMSFPGSRASRGGVLATNDACVYNRVHASASPRGKTRGQPGEYVGKYKVMLINF